MSVGVSIPSSHNFCCWDEMCMIKMYKAKMIKIFLNESVIISYQLHTGPVHWLWICAHTTEIKSAIGSLKSLIMLPLEQSVKFSFCWSISCCVGFVLLDHHWSRNIHTHRGYTDTKIHFCKIMHADMKEEVYVYRFIYSKQAWLGPTSVDMLDNESWLKYTVTNHKNITGRFEC